MSAPPLPYQQTEGCARIVGSRHWQVRSGDLRVGILVRRHGVLPWYRLARIQRFGRHAGEDAPGAVDAAIALARERTVLRLHVEVWSEIRSERERLAQILRSRGFEVPQVSRTYRDTVWIDLLPGQDESELLATFHATCRRHIRAPARRGYRVCTISDPAMAERLEALIGESFRRTGGRPPAVDWAELLRQSSRDGAPVHVVGLEKVGVTGPGRMVGFAVAYLHGSVAEYAHAGSTRTPDRVPLLYAPTWELMKWARRRGARHWDFGGIVDDPGSSLDGIRDFKHMYEPTTTQVGTEWVLHVRPRLSRLLQRFPRPVRSA